MKTVLRVIGVVCLLFAVFMFLYASVKRVDANKVKENKIQVADGITVVNDNPEKERSDIGVITSGIFLGVGIVLLVASRKGKGRK